MSLSHWFSKESGAYAASKKSDTAGATLLAKPHAALGSLSSVALSSA
jgi:hypothetical protein